MIGAQPITHIFQHCTGVTRWGTTRALVVILDGRPALAKPYAIRKHGFVTRVHSHMSPLTYETFSREFSLFFFPRFRCMTNSDGLKWHIRTARPVLTLQVAGGKWRCPGRFKHIPPSNPRSQRPAGSASLRRGSPIPGTYFTNPVKRLKNHTSSNIESSAPCISIN